MFFTRDKSFYKTLVTLAIPIALQNAVTFAVGLAAVSYTHLDVYKRQP